MPKSLTIQFDEQLYADLDKAAGDESVDHYLESLVRSHLRQLELEAGYAAMAADTEHEAEANEWIEALVGDVGDETW